MFMSHLLSGLYEQARLIRPGRPNRGTVLPTSQITTSASRLAARGISVAGKLWCQLTNPTN